MSGSLVLLTMVLHLPWFSSEWFSSSTLTMVLHLPQLSSELFSSSKLTMVQYLPVVLLVQTRLSVAEVRYLVLRLP